MACILHECYAPVRQRGNRTTQMMDRIMSGQNHKTQERSSALRHFVSTSLCLTQQQKRPTQKSVSGVVGCMSKTSRRLGPV